MIIGIFKPLKYSNEIINSTFISTFCSSGNIRGIKDFELVRQFLRPGDDFNDFQASLNTFIKFGAYFHHSEDSFYFDTQEKPFAKVEYRSLSIPSENALNFSLQRWNTHIFNDSSSIVLRDTLQVKKDSLEFDKNSPRFILSPKRLHNSESKKIYHGFENPNFVILIEPKSDTFNIFENHDIIKWAQLSLAASELKSSASDYDCKRQYERIELDNIKYIDESLKSAGFSYVLFIEIDGIIDFELESVGNSNYKNDILVFLNKNFYPRIVFQEHFLNSIQHFREVEKSSVFNQIIKDIKDIYKKTLSFPILLAESIFD